MKLKAIDLSNNPLGGVELDKLLNSAPGLEECHLERCDLPAGALSALHKVHQSSKVENLSLGYNQLGSEDLETLLHLDSLPALVSIQLRGNPTTPEARQKLLDAWTFPRYNLTIESPSSSSLR